MVTQVQQGGKWSKDNSLHARLIVFEDVSSSRKLQTFTAACNSVRVMNTYLFAYDLAAPLRAKDGVRKQLGKILVDMSQRVWPLACSK